jgi:hyperosmotically inducible protein
VSGLAIDVDTKNGVVMLKGSVDNKAQADKAVAVTKKIDGVKKVDSSGLKVKKTGY